METRYDFIQIKADVSPEGWIRDKPIITRAGIFSYRKPDGTIRRELRIDSEVFAEPSLSSLTGIPITDGHNGLVTKDNAKAIIGTVISPGARSDSNVVADIIIHDPNRLGAKRELSLGYQCEIEETKGNHNGQEYDAIQRKISYNHLAVVNKGRAGNARLRLDSSSAVSGSFEMENDMADNTPKLVTYRIDGIDYQGQQEIVNALTKEQEARKDLQKRFDGLEAERDSLKSAADKHKTEIQAMKESIRDEIKTRTAIETVAKQLELKLDENESIVDVKKKVVAKLKPSIKLDGKSDDYIASAFDLAVEEYQEKNKKVSDQKSRMDSKGNGSDPKPESAEAARAAYVKNLRERHEAALKKSA